MALIVPTVAIILLDAVSVARVEDIGEIPRTLPTPALPDLSLISADLVVNAFAIAVIILVQGAGVSESAPNADAPPT